MGLQFEQITYAPQLSLTQIVEDTTFLRQAGAMRKMAREMDIEAWLNAIQLQSRPLVQSKASRAALEAWLEAAELASASPQDDEAASL